MGDLLGWLPLLRSVWLVGLGGAGTVCHRVGRVDFILTFDSSPIKETFAKPTVIPA